MSRHYKNFRVEDLRLKLNRMKEEREREGAGKDPPPPDPGYNYLRDPSRDHQDHQHYQPGYRGRGHRGNYNEYEDKRENFHEYEDRRGHRHNFHEYGDRRGHRGNFHEYENRRGGHRGSFHEHEDRRGNFQEYEDREPPHAHRKEGSNTYYRGGYPHLHRAGKSGHVSENKAFINELNHGKPVNVKVEVQIDTGNRVYSCDESQTFDYRSIRGDRRGQRGQHRGRFHDNVHHSECGSRGRGYRPRGRGFYRGRSFSRGRRGGENPNQEKNEQLTERNEENEVDKVVEGLNTLELEESWDVDGTEQATYLNHDENDEGHVECYEYDGEHCDNEEYHQDFAGADDDSKDKEVISQTSLENDKEVGESEKLRIDLNGECAEKSEMVNK